MYLATKFYFDAKLLESKINEQELSLNDEKDDLYNEYSNNDDEKILDKIKEIDKEIANIKEQKSIVISKLNQTDEIINDIAIALYTDKDAKDKFWQEQAKSGFLAIYYLMLETIETKYFNNKKYSEINIDELIKEYSKVNLPSIAIALSNLQEIKQYFSFIEQLRNIDMQAEFKTRKSYINGASIFNNKSENTVGSVVATINVGLEQYKQSTIQNITTTNEIELDKLTEKEKPVALFIVVPDEKENSYKFATLLIDQLYKANIGLAATKLNQKLNRALMFYLDEFGNIPTIPKFDTMITVSRSRGIYFCIAIQGFDQLNARYGKEQAKIIIENMLLHIYVSTTDMDTIKYYQQRAGSYTIYKTSASHQNDRALINGSTSTNLDKKELLNIDDIKNNPSDMLLIFYQNLDVSWVKTSAYWMCNDLQINKINYESIFNSVRIFDFKNNYFNIFNLLKNEINEIINYDKYKQDLNELKTSINLSNIRKEYLIKSIKENENFNELDLIDVDTNIVNNDIKKEENELNKDMNFLKNKYNHHSKNDKVQDFFNELKKR